MSFPNLQAQPWSSEILSMAKGDALDEMYMERDSDDTNTDDHWSSEEEAMQERMPPPPKQLPPP